MQCACGGELTESTHEVKTLAKAIEWSSLVQSQHLPIHVHQSKCVCGRMMRKVYDNQKNVIFRKG